jgi:hypothetical protein
MTPSELLKPEGREGERAPVENNNRTKPEQLKLMKTFLTKCPITIVS